MSYHMKNEFNEKSQNTCAVFSKITEYVVRSINFYYKLKHLDPRK